jgi:hypothetical protein
MEWSWSWFSFIVGAVAAPVALAACLVVGALVQRLTSTNHGSSSCLVCDERFTCEPGIHTRIGIWLRTRRHDWFTATRREHREAWAHNRWNPFRVPGAGDDGGVAAIRRAMPNPLVRAWWFITS